MRDVWIRSRAGRPLVALVAGAFGVVGLSWWPASASEPESTDVKITAEPGTTTYTWTGEVGPAPTGLVGAATDPCTHDEDLEDIHTIKLDLAARVYKSVVAEFTFQIAWDDGNNDLALLVSGEQGTVGTSDGGDPVETVAAINLDEGEYVVNPCAFAAAGVTEYRGSLKVVIKEKRKPKAVATAPPASTASTIAPRPSSGSSSSGSAPLPAAPTRRPSGSSAAASTPVTAPSPLPPVEAAPPAFISSGVDPLESAAPPPVAVVAKDTKSMPLGVALLVSVLGLGGLAGALLVRRRRGLDQAPGASIVPVTS